MMDQNRLSLLALHFIPGIGDRLVRQLISYCGSAERVFHTPRGKLLNIPGVGAVTAQAIVKGKPFEDAEQEMRRAEAAGVSLVFFSDKHYPTRLKTLNDAPSLLYCKGNLDLENVKTVGIVGTRQATRYGREQVEKLIQGLKPHAPLIVSGLAYGIDIHAHKYSVKHALPTVGVMGSGIDVIYPSSHEEVVRKMLELGGLVTENPFGTQPDAHHFPARNRIIAGLSDALIVVEAAERGGALITANIANSYNKDVFACPGNIGQSHSEGCNNLIKSNKANLLTSIKDLEYMMNWSAEDGGVKKKAALSMEGFEGNEQSILQALANHGEGQLTLDELGWRLNLSISQLASVLLGLELKGAIRSLPGKLYKLSGQ
jgi:DNA processing protein